MKSVSITMIVLFVLGCGFLWYLFEYRPEQKLDRETQAAKHTKCIRDYKNLGFTPREGKEACDSLYKK